jgi:hypothetical protein
LKKAGCKNSAFYVNIVIEIEEALFKMATNISCKTIRINENRSLDIYGYQNHMTVKLPKHNFVIISFKNKFSRNMYMLVDEKDCHSRTTLKSCLDYIAGKDKLSKAERKRIFNYFH